MTAVPAAAAAAAAAAPPVPSSADVPSPSRHSRCVVVSNLSPVLTLPILEDLFSTIGPIHSLHFHSPSPTSERVCIVQFVHEKHADTALLITDTPIGDRNIRIQHYREWSSQPTQQPTPSPTSGSPASAAAAAVAAALAASAAPAPAASSPALLSPPPAGAPTDPSLLPSSTGFLPATATSPPSTPFPFPLDPSFTSRTIYVGNLAPHVTDAVLHAYFSQLGPLVGTKLQADAMGPNRFGQQRTPSQPLHSCPASHPLCSQLLLPCSSAAAFVEFEGLQAAHLALALHGHALLGRPMKIGKAAMGVGRTGVQQGGGGGLGVAATAEKVAAALAKVAAAQQSIASKLGVQVHTPAVSTILPSLPIVGIAPAAAAELVVKAAGGESETGRRQTGKEAPTAGAEEREDREGRRGRDRRRSSSRGSPSHSSSSSRSASRSRSGSRSPRRHRHHRSGSDRHRHGRSSRERSHRRSRHRRSSSRSPSPRAGERKEEGPAPVGTDRWRAEDGDDASQEKKDTITPPLPPPTADAHREGDRSPGRDRRREHSRERSGGRSREGSRERRPPHGRRGEHHDGHRLRRKRDWSDEEEDRFSHHSRRGGPHFRRRNRGVAADPHQGMVWDGSARRCSRTRRAPRMALHWLTFSLSLSCPVCSASRGTPSAESSCGEVGRWSGDPEESTSRGERLPPSQLLAREALDSGAVVVFIHPLPFGNVRRLVGVERCPSCCDRIQVMVGDEEESATQRDSSWRGKTQVSWSTVCEREGVIVSNKLWRGRLCSGGRR